MVSLTSALTRPIHPIIAGSLALVASWLLSGCRLGNQVAAQPEKHSRQGYYDTEPSAIVFATNVRDGDFRGSTELIPSVVQSVMSNPVIFGYSEKYQTYGIFNHTADGAFRVDFKNDKDVSTTLSGSRPAFFLSEDCSREITLEFTGELSAYEKPQPSQLAEVDSVGRIGGVYTVIETLKGDCTQTLQDIAACRNDSTQCQGESAEENTYFHDYWTAYFEPYLQSGALTEAEIPQLQAFGYQVAYQ